jgi:Uma2 family endonuclease
MTLEEFDALEPEDFDDRYHYELIRGVLVVTPPAGNAEVDPNEELGHLLRNYQDDHPQGAALDVTLPERTVPTTANRRRGDRAIWAGLGRLPDEEKDIPTIVVEFVSASRRDHRRDYEEKLQEYLTAGVLEYWIIDRFRRIMTVNRKGTDGVITQVIQESGSYQTELLPGFVLPLARLLAKADQWPRKRRPRPPARGSD